MRISFYKCFKNKVAPNKTFFIPFLSVLNIISTAYITPVSHGFPCKHSCFFKENIEMLKT